MPPAVIPSCPVCVWAVSCGSNRGPSTSSSNGDVRVADIDPQQIATFFDKLRKDHSRSVVQKVWTLFRSILEDAVDDDIIGKNPFRRVPMPKTKLPKRPVLATEIVPKVL